MDDRSGVRSIRSVDYIIILCDDLEPMRRFYAEVLEFPIHEEKPGVWVGFRIGSQWLGLRPRGRSYDGPAVPGSAASLQLSFRVPPTDVDLAFESLRSHDVDVIEEPRNQDWPHRTLFVRDPENNVLEIFADIDVNDTATGPSGVHTIVEP